jgi:hypothetical protein
MTSTAWTGPGPLPRSPVWPTRPHRVVGKLIDLRQHDHCGPAKIAMYLQRDHHLQLSHSGMGGSPKRLDLNRLPASQRHQRHDRRRQR